MTVSRTLAGNASVRPDLQEKVFDAVRELGYHRNENARSLRPGQASGLIGVVITSLQDPYFSTFAAGVEEAVAESGRRILLGNSGADTGRERQLVADFLGRQVEGLVVAPLGGAAEHLRPERIGSVPLVLAANRVPGLDVDTVLIDDVDGAFQATRALLEAGHKRIAFIENDPAAFTGTRRLDGYRAAHQAQGIDVDPELVVRSKRQADDAVDTIHDLLDRPSPPTAIFAANNRNAVSVLCEIGQRLRAGASAGDMPELGCIDVLELAELMPVPIAMVEHSPRQLGLEAGRLLVSRLDGTAREDEPARLIELPVNLVRTGNLA